MLLELKGGVEMKIFKKLLLNIVIIISVLMFVSRPCFATESLTSKQQAYLQQYVLTYVQEIEKKGIYEYYEEHDKEISYDNHAHSDGTIKYCCASFCSSMLHQALGANLIDYDKSKAPTYDRNIRTTSFFSPDKNPAFVNVNNEEYVQPGDVIIGGGYRWHAMLYIGINPTTRKTPICRFSLWKITNYRFEFTSQCSSNSGTTKGDK